MSASDKKKLRKAQGTEKLTQRQREERAEAKKLKVYTTVFLVAVIVIACVAVGTLLYRHISSSGIFERSTIAAQIGDEKLDTAVMAYYYNDAINKMYSSVYAQYGDSYASTYFDMMGLDLSKPLNEQTYDMDKEKYPEGTTWADFFIDSALETAKSDYALYKLAKDAGYKLDEETQASYDEAVENLSNTAGMYGYSNADQYLKAVYGNGARLSSYKDYLYRNAVAQSFYQNRFQGLSFDDAALREYESEHKNDFNSYDYSYGYISYQSYLEGGTEGEDGTTEYSEEEKNAARAKAKEVADALGAAKTAEELKTMSGDQEIVGSTVINVTSQKHTLHTNIDTTLSDWLADADRKIGEIGIIENVNQNSESEEKEINGYYVIVLEGKTDNNQLMSNVRHLLVSFEGGTTDENTGTTTYTDEEKAIAKTEAESLLKKWQDGDATEESFIELVKQYSDDSSAESGGLYENINPDSQYVENFLNWSIDDSRKTGDVEIVETEYGYHIMYYVGKSEESYRDHMIRDILKNEDQDAWYEGVLNDVTVEKKDMSRLRLDLVISGN